MNNIETINTCTLPKLDLSSSKFIVHLEINYMVTCPLMTLSISRFHMTETKSTGIETLRFCPSAQESQILLKSQCLELSDAEGAVSLCYSEYNA